MRDLMRLIATTIIWGVLMAVTGVMLTVNSDTGPISRMNGGEIVAMLAILMTGAVAMTYAMWHSGFQRGQLGDYSSKSQHRDEQINKQKRQQQGRIERLIAELDDDDIYELEARLLAREEEEEPHAFSRRR